jgi:hypothetical protein
MGGETLVAKVNSTYSVLILIGVTVGTLAHGSLGAAVSVLLVISVYALFFTNKLIRELAF